MVLVPSWEAPIHTRGRPFKIRRAMSFIIINKTHLEIYHHHSRRKWQDAELLNKSSGSHARRGTHLGSEQQTQPSCRDSNLPAFQIYPTRIPHLHNSGHAVSIMLSRRPTSVLLTLLAVLFLTHPSSAIKFSLPAQRYPPAKCIWNAAHVNALVIVTANVGPGANQRVDIEIVDSSPEKNVYLHKRGISGETRLAITSHAEGEVGVCFKNHLDIGVFFCYATKGLRRTDL